MEAQRIRKMISWRRLCSSAVLVMGFLVLLAPIAHAQQGRWYTEFFPNTTLSGPPVLTRTDNAVHFEWGAGSPAVGVPADGFSARWTRTEWLDAGTHRFTGDDSEYISLSDITYEKYLSTLIAFDAAKWEPR